MRRRTSVPEETMRFARWVKRARTARGLSQVDLAAEAGMVGSEICSLERGQRNPTIATAMKLVEALGFRMVFVTKSEFDRIAGARDRRRKFAPPEPESIEVDTRNPNP